MRSRRCARWGLIVSILLTIVAIAAWVPSAQATTYTLGDGNSVVTIDPESQAGMYNWVVSGTNQLHQQWFWYRVGSTAETSIDMLTLSSAILLDASTLKLVYSGDGLNIKILYALSGGSPGSVKSDIAETITITNTSSASKDFHFFQYSDFDLNGTSGGDTARLVNANTIDQRDATQFMNETIATPAASHYQIDYYANILNALNDGVATTLNDSSPMLGPGDITWAWEWDATLGANGGEIIISKDKRIGPVPEPGTLLLLGFGIVGIAVGLGAFRRHI